MKCLVVIAHPNENSLCTYLAEQVVNHLKQKGYDITIKDLYREKFNPVLSQSERKSYYEPEFDTSGLNIDIKQLKESECLVLIFPTWWFGFPAILKGWFDRVWAPGHAYQHANDFGPLKPLLRNLREVKVITTLGSPWWVDILVLWQPVKRILKLALVGTCTKNCKFKMLSLYQCEKVSESRINKFVNRIKSEF